MKVSKLLITITVLITIIGFNQRLFSWGLLNLFTDIKFNKQNLENAKNFDSDKDILYLPPLEDKNLFMAIDDLSICRKKDVRKYIYIYLTSGRKFVKRAITRSYKYHDIIDEIFKENSDIPEEISFLPLLESGFSPYAVSRSKAVGLWQFVKNTSNPLGLKRNRWLDERRDIEKSTEAAIRHLRNLYKMFDSWELALTAYNGGAGHVKRSMNKTGAKDLWELRKTGALKNEPNEYVPKFIALLVIYKNQALFGIEDELDIPEATETDTIVLKQPVNIKHVSKYSDVPIETIRDYNPELKSNITPPHLNGYILRLPVEGKEKLLKNKKMLYKKRITRVKRYRVKEGDCISIIAKKYKKKLQLS